MQVQGKKPYNEINITPLVDLTFVLLIIFILLTTIATAFAFAPIRKAAAWLLMPYMVWLSFAAILNFQIDQRNPDAETLVPHAASTQI